MGEILYILGDADRVREKIEGRLLAGDLAEVAKLSASLTSGLANLVRMIEETLHAETIMAGGDDVLFRAPADMFSAVVLKGIADKFPVDTGCTISFGVGTEVTVAYLNLRKAKAAGGGSVVYTQPGAA